MTLDSQNLAVTARLPAAPGAAMAQPPSLLDARYTGNRPAAASAQSVPAGGGVPKERSLTPNISRFGTCSEANFAKNISTSAKPWE
jgi:hypothetical protein